MASPAVPPAKPSRERLASQLGDLHNSLRAMRRDIEILRDAVRDEGIFVSGLEDLLHAEAEAEQHRARLEAELGLTEDPGGASGHV